MMRKAILRAASLLLCMALVLAGGEALAGDAGNSFGEIRYIDTPRGSSVNLRADTSTSAEILTSIPYGAAVTSYGYVTRNWVSCSYRGMYGYVYGQYLSLYPPSPRPVPTPTPRPQPYSGLFSGFYQVSYQVSVSPTRASGFVNLRWAPSLDMPVLNYYYAGTILSVLSQNDTWCQVFDPQNRMCGFMMREFLSYYGGDGYGGDGYGVGVGAYSTDSGAYPVEDGSAGVGNDGVTVVTPLPRDDGADGDGAFG